MVSATEMLRSPRNVCAYKETDDCKSGRKRPPGEGPFTTEARRTRSPLRWCCGPGGPGPSWSWLVEISVGTGRSARPTRQDSGVAGKGPDDTAGKKRQAGAE